MPGVMPGGSATIWLPTVATTYVCCFYHILFSDSCPEFGSSGSGVVRSWKKRQDKKILSIDGACDPFGVTCNVDDVDNSPIDQTEAPIDAYQYSFVGPLSMQKGCDNAFHMYTRKVFSVQSVPKNNGIDYETNKLSYRGMKDFVFCSLIMDKINLFKAKTLWWPLMLVASCPGLPVSTI